MAKKSRRVFTDEQRAAILAELASKSPHEVCEAYGLSPSLLYRWRQLAGMPTERGAVAQSQRRRARAATNGEAITQVIGGGATAPSALALAQAIEATIDAMTKKNVAEYMRQRFSGG